MTETSGNKIFDPQTYRLVEMAFRNCGKAPEVLPDEALLMAKESISLVFSDWMNSLRPTWLQTPIDVGSVNNQDLNGKTKIVFGNAPDQPAEDSFYAPEMQGADLIDDLIITDSLGNATQYPEQIDSKDFNQYRVYFSEDGRNNSFAYWFNQTKSPKSLWFLSGFTSEDNLAMMVTFKPDIITSNLQNLEIPSRAQSAFVYALSVKLATQVQGGMEKLPMLIPLYEDAMMKLEDRENDGTDTVFEPELFSNMQNRGRRFRI